MKNLSWRAHLSWVVLVLGGLWGMSMARSGGEESGTDLRTAIMTGYICWSLYWGLPPFWRWWKRRGSQAGWTVGCVPGMSLIHIALVFAGLVVGGYFFSVFGGGLYHFGQYLRTARHQI